ncbi:hypothetical protein C0992_006662 [Termitomyces sp. T32_za158]|nr:hypothetical protein C0992_006662 [Termitomyces sp. T32_za158]
MAVLESNDQLGQLWSLIQELSEQLNRNRSVSVSLLAQAGSIKKDVQEQELSLIRDYETKLLARQDEYVAQDLASAVAFSQSLARISLLLRQFLRSLNGEDPASPVVSQDDEDNLEPWGTMTASQHALERETELSRLETENEELRRMLDSYATPRNRRDTSEVRPIFESPRRERDDEMMDVRNLDNTTAVGPFGTYKRLRPQV